VKNIVITNNLTNLNLNNEIRDSLSRKRITVSLQYTPKLTAQLDPCKLFVLTVKKVNKLLNGVTER